MKNKNQEKTNTYKSFLNQKNINFALNHRAVRELNFFHNQAFADYAKPTSK